MTLREQIQFDEGFRADPYPDFKGDADREKVRGLWRAFLEAGGTVAVGYGRNLSTNPLTGEEAGYLLNNDLQRVEGEVLGALPWVNGLDAPRRAVILNMAYNLGTGSSARRMGLLGFPRMLEALKKGDYQIAADEMLDSRWAGQVGERATRLARQMVSGAWQ